MQFRQLEFINAFMASQSPTESNTKKSIATHITFTDATPTVDEQDDLYGAMQYIHTANVNIELCNDAIIEATKRSSLVREVYQIVAVGKSYEDLALVAMKGDGLSDLMTGAGSNSDVSWCVRLRQYGSTDEKKGARFGVSKRSSMKREKELLIAMKPLLQSFHGPVRLKNPNCALYVFEGLHMNTSTRDAKMVLVRKLARGASTQSIAPNTRQCITNTPLCPLASFIMCNLARIKEGDRVLDPYSGSCSTLLAAAMIAPSCKTVGVEIAEDEVISRSDIMSDFQSRHLTPPVALITGDCTEEHIRDKARAAVQDEPFDVILADPPYGRREKASKDSEAPLVQVIQCIEQDWKRGKPLLKKDGRLVAFIPTNDGESIESGLPMESQLHSAGLRLLSITEQPLSDTLSRWLAVYECTR